MKNDAWDRYIYGKRASHPSIDRMDMSSKLGEGPGTGMRQWGKKKDGRRVYR
jgi:hypothetical protein